MKKALLSLLLAGCLPPPDRPTPDEMLRLRPGARALVVVHSRSGNTARVADVLARELEASSIRLAVPPRSGDGFFRTPNRHAAVTFEPAHVDLSPYPLVLLGSPIWYWRPSAFIYAFIRNHDFTGKRVVLFFTYEGGLSRSAVDEWRSLVESRGGRVVDVVSIDRKKERDPPAAMRHAIAARGRGWTAD